jgi:hypothetical protein
MHMLFQFIYLLHSQLIFTEVENLLTEHFEDAKIILADVQISLNGSTNGGNEGLLGSIPFELYNLNQDRVCL